VGFPRLTVPGVGIDEWTAGLVEAEGVLLLPGSQFGFGGNHFRLGFGRTDLPPALERLEAYATRTLR
jgi:aspartate/methionine/tyrosine aminotransferase